jgi:hypothetical protein
VTAVAFPAPEGYPDAGRHVRSTRDGIYVLRSSVEAGALIARSCPPTRPSPMSNARSAPSAPTWTSAPPPPHRNPVRAHVFMRMLPCTSPGTCRLGSRPSCSPTTRPPPSGCPCTAAAPPLHRHASNYSASATASAPRSQQRAPHHSEHPGRRHYTWITGGELRANGQPKPSSKVLPGKGNRSVIGVTPRRPRAAGRGSVRCELPVISELPGSALESLMRPPRSGIHDTVTISLPVACHPPRAACASPLGNDWWGNFPLGPICQI